MKTSKRGAPTTILYEDLHQNEESTDSLICNDWERFLRVYTLMIDISKWLLVLRYWETSNHKIYSKCVI